MSCSVSPASSGSITMFAHNVARLTRYRSLSTNAPATLQRFSTSASTGAKRTANSFTALSTVPAQRLQLFDGLRQTLEALRELRQIHGVGGGVLQLFIGGPQTPPGVAFLGDEATEQCTGARVDRAVVEDRPEAGVAPRAAVAEDRFELLDVARARAQLRETELEVVGRLVAHLVTKFTEALRERRGVLGFANRDGGERLLQLGIRG